MVCSLTLCLLAISGTGAWSASRRIETICSSVNRLFFIGSLSDCGSHSLKLQLVLKTWAGHELADNDVNRPDTIVLGDVVLQTLGKEGALRPILTFNETLHPRLPSIRRGESTELALHYAFTQSRPKAGV